MFWSKSKAPDAEPVSRDVYTKKAFKVIFYGLLVTFGGAYGAYNFYIKQHLAVFEQKVGHAGMQLPKPVASNADGRFVIGKGPDGGLITTDDPAIARDYGALR